MTEHELYMARRSNISRINHGNFRRKHLLAEKKQRTIIKLRKAMREVA